jgi:1,4-alpha-glucan branching enzyme
MWNVMTNRLPDVKTIAYCESHDQALVGDQTIAFRLMQAEIYFHMHKEDNDLVVDRGMALHKMIRLFTITLGGQAYLNFMGNEFGHPDWIDFPREGNNWSYHYARRMWSLVENKNLKYHFLGAFDKSMLKLVSENNLLFSDWAKQLNMDDANKTIVFERNGLIFIFNFHISHSIPDYQFVVPEPGDYKIILNTDNSAFGGHGRIDESTVFMTRHSKEDQLHRLKIYSTNRTAVVLKRITTN